MSGSKVVVGGAALFALALLGFGLGSHTDLTPGDLVPAMPVKTETVVVTQEAPLQLASTKPTRNCEDWGIELTDDECHAAGAIRFVGLYNLYQSGQFCKWQAANPGEWSRLQGYASSATTPTQIITWLGGSIKNELEAYFVAGGPPFVMNYTAAPNRCKTPLAPPNIQGVTPGETDVTVTVGP